MAFSHGGTESTEEPLVFSSEYSVFSVALCAFLFEHAKHLAVGPIPGREAALAGIMICTWELGTSGGNDGTTYF